jgi:hypothetical protein
MPQISLYIDVETLTKIEIAAKINNTSISKWVSERLKESLTGKWPDKYRNLFGCIDDDTFNVEKVQGFDTDLKREHI